MLELYEMEMGKSYVRSEQTALDISAGYEQTGKDEYIEWNGNLVLRQYFKHASTVIQVVWHHREWCTVTRL